MNRTPPDRPEHDLLRRYLEGWARHAFRGAAASEGTRPVVYLEAFASGALGGLAPTAAGAAYATALHAIAVLDAAAAEAPATPWAAVLVEEDPEQVRRLVERLGDAGLGARVRRGGVGEALMLGEIRVVEGAFAAVAPALTDVLGDAAVFCWAEPPAAAALPLPAVQALAALPGLTLLLRFPVADFEKQLAFCGTPLADLAPYARRLLHGGSALLGDAGHRWLLRWRGAAAQRGAAAATREAAGDYAAALAAIDAALLARTLPLATPTTEQLLVLLGRDPDTPFLLNRALFDARRAGTVVAPEAEQAFVHFVESDVLELFDGGATAQRTRVADLAAVAEALAAEFAGRTVPFREVLRAMAATELLLAEVKRALTVLRGKGRVRYRLLNAADAELSFPTTPAPPPPRAARRPSCEPAAAAAALWDGLP